MAAPDITTVHYPQGRLFLNPTDGTLASPNSAPFGGTALGLVESVALVPVVRSFTITMEEYGSEAGDVVELGNDWVMTCVMTGWDDDTISTVFASTATGAGAGDELVTEPGITPGQMGSSRAVKIAFVPDDPTDRGFIIYRALPMLEESKELTYNVRQPQALGLVFRCMRDANGITLREGRPGDLIP
jgi:hypothetical protein